MLQRIGGGINMAKGTFVYKSAYEAISHAREAIAYGFTGTTVTLGDKIIGRTGQHVVVVA
jgi:hypothetical protein